MGIRKKVTCKKCRRLFFIDLGSKEINIEIKCPKCGYLQTINNTDKKGVDILYKNK